MKTDTVTSQDGTIISYQTTGSGPAVIVVPGVLSHAADYAAFAAALGKNFTVHTIERRGRGESGAQGSDYSIATECEDVRALQAKTRAQYIFGHSFGGLVSLEAARNNASFKKVAVYEPGVSVDGSLTVAWAGDYQKLLDQNKRLDAFVDFSLAMGPTAAQKTPRWLMKMMMPMVVGRKNLKAKLEMLESNLREHTALAALDNTYPHYREISAPVLLMAGGKSGLAWVSPMIKRLQEVLPQSRVQEFPKLNHFGPDHTGPAEVATAVSEFFTA